MSKFWKKMISTDADVSSKRIVGLISFLIIILMAVGNIFWDKTPAQFIFEGFLYITLGCFGLNAVIDIFRKPKEEPYEEEGVVFDIDNNDNSKR